MNKEFFFFLDRNCKKIRQTICTIFFVCEEAENSLIQHDLTDALFCFFKFVIFVFFFNGVMYIVYHFFFGKLLSKGRRHIVIFGWRIAGLASNSNTLLLRHFFLTLLHFFFF